MVLKMLKRLEVSPVVSIQLKFSVLAIQKLPPIANTIVSVEVSSPRAHNYLPIAIRWMHPVKYSLFSLLCQLALKI